jgi:hypothetical protein
VLGAPFKPDEWVRDLFERGTAYDKALEERLDLAKRDRYIAEMMHLLHLDRSDLKQMFTLLIANGAGQWERSHFVAASALVFPQTLLYYDLALRRGEDIRHVAFELLEYFRLRRTGFVREEDRDVLMRLLSARETSSRARFRASFPRKRESSMTPAMRKQPAAFIASCTSKCTTTTPRSLHPKNNSKSGPGLGNCNW